MARAIKNGIVQLALPEHLQVGPIRYRIVREAMNDCGKCHYSGAEIKIDTQINEQIARVAVLHETLHAILFGGGFTASSGRHDEELIDCISHGLIQVIRDNPWFVEVICPQ